MSTRGSTNVLAGNRRASWAVFWGVSGVGLAAGIVGAAAMGNRATVAMAVLMGLIVIGIGVALMDSILSPLQQGDLRSQMAHCSGGIAAAGGAGGGFGGGGDCGGGGGSCG